MRHVRTKGTAAVLNIFRILSNRFVSVTEATRIALLESGEHLSPKKQPEITAPPLITGLTPAVPAIVILITPIVAAVPNEVPVIKETRQFIKKMVTIRIDGLNNPAADDTI